MADTRTYESKIAGWSSPYGDIAVQLWWLTTGEFQVREIHSTPDASTFALYPGTDDGLAAARADARMRAEIIRFNQPLEG
jgi:hypothetical protein